MLVASHSNTTAVARAVVETTKAVATIVVGIKVAEAEKVVVVTVEKEGRGVLLRRVAWTRRPFHLLLYLLPFLHLTKRQQKKQKR
jgi:hypothetical protein